MKSMIAGGCAAISLACLAQAPLPPTAAEVRKIDLGAKTITLKHGAIQNLSMPAMSMVFQVRDVAMLNQVQTGDRVQVTVENTAAGLTIMTIERTTP